MDCYLGLDSAQLPNYLPFLSWIRNCLSFLNQEIVEKKHLIIPIIVKNYVRLIYDSVWRKSNNF